MSTDTTIASQSHSLVKVAGMEGYWANRSGGEVSADVSQAWDGGADFPDQVPGKATTSDVTVSRPYRRGRDDVLRRRLLKQVGKLRATVSDQPTDSNGQALGEPDVWPNALLRQVSAIGSDASSSDPKTIELVFAVSRTA